MTKKPWPFSARWKARPVHFHIAAQAVTPPLPSRPVLDAERNQLMGLYLSGHVRPKSSTICHPEQLRNRGNQAASSFSSLILAAMGGNDAKSSPARSKSNRFRVV